MKNKFTLLFTLVALAVLLFQGCKNNEREIGDPWNHIEGLTSTGWVLSEVEMIDEGNPARPRRSLSNFFTSTDDRMTLEFSTDGTFISVPGEGGQVFPLSGTWAFDLDEAPRRININDGSDVLVANLGSPVRPIDPQLKLEIVKRFCEVDGAPKPVLGYRFTFDRKN